MIIGGMFMKSNKVSKADKGLYVSRGNIKVKACIFNMPCKVTCKAGLECHKYCYAAKAEYLYPQVKPCRMNNLKLSKRADFVENMIKLIKRRRAFYFRIHESGDFYSKAYIKSWYKIIKAIPDKHFYAYTKRSDLFTKALLKAKPDNMTLIYSIDGIQEKPIDQYKVPAGYDKIAFTHKTDNNCPAIENDNIKCMLNCKKCVNKADKLIIFRKH